MELLQYWRIVRKRLWVILLLVLVGLASAAYYTEQQPVVYQSSATLLLNPAVPSSLVPYLQSDYASNLADNYAELMRSDSFGESVSKELSGTVSAGEVAGAISTQRVPNTLFFKISAAAGSAQTSKRIVDATVKVFLSANAAQQQAQADQGAGSTKSAMRDLLSSKLQYLEDQIKSYQDQITAQQKQPPSVARDDQLFQLRSQLVALQQTETESMVALTGIEDTTAPRTTALVIDPARPGYATSRKLVQNLSGAFAASLALGLALIFLLNYLDYTVRSPEYLEQVLGLAPLAAIGVVGGSSTRGYYRYGRGRKRKGNGAPAATPEAPASAEPGLVTLTYPRAPESESFRVLRTNLQFSSLEKPIRSLVVTSVAPGEGKTFTAANLAIVLAQAGKRVILVDTDLRRPGLHKIFKLPNTVGFTNLVLDSSSDGVQATQVVAGVPNLRVLTSGPLPPDPAELLDTASATQVMARLAKFADIVIYDSPPAGIVTDPVVLATRADAVLLVINAGSTRRDGIARVRRTLENVGVKRLVPVLNRVRAQDMHGYYYYSGYYYSPDEPVAAVATNGHSARANGKSAVVVESTPKQSASSERGADPPPEGGSSL